MAVAVRRQEIPAEAERHGTELGFPLTYSYTQGCEKILLGGWLAHILEWSREELDDMVEYASTEGTARLHLIGMELLARQFGNGERQKSLEKN